MNKRGKSTFGYQVHIGVDLESDLNKTITLTPAHVHVSTEFDHFLTREGQSMFADKAYSKAERKRQLRSDGVLCGILGKGYLNCNRVGRIFPSWVKDYGYLKTRYITLAPDAPL